MQENFRHCQIEVIKPSKKYFCIEYENSIVDIYLCFQKLVKSTLSTEKCLCYLLLINFRLPMQKMTKGLKFNSTQPKKLIMSCSANKVRMSTHE